MMNLGKLSKEVFVEIVFIVFSLINLDLANPLNSFFDEAFVRVVSRSFTQNQVTLQCKILYGAARCLICHTVGPL